MMLVQRLPEFDHEVLICLAVKFKSFRPAPTLDAAAKCPRSISISLTCTAIPIAGFRVATVASGLFIPHKSFG